MKRNPQHVALVLEWRANLSASARLPQANRGVVAARGEPAAIGIECHARHGKLVLEGFWILRCRSHAPHASRHRRLPSRQMFHPAKRPRPGPGRRDAAEAVTGLPASDSQTRAVWSSDRRDNQPATGAKRARAPRALRA